MVRHFAHDRRGRPGARPSVASPLRLPPRAGVHPHGTAGRGALVLLHGVVRGVPAGARRGQGVGGFLRVTEERGALPGFPRGALGVRRGLSFALTHRRSGATVPRGLAFPVGEGGEPRRFDGARRSAVPPTRALGGRERREHAVLHRRARPGIPSGLVLPRRGNEPTRLHLGGPRLPTGALLEGCTGRGRDEGALDGLLVGARISRGSRAGDRSRNEEGGDDERKYETTHGKPP